MAMEQKAKNAINLKGSAQLICEYLRFSINSVIFQRGIYPPETFKAQQQYGLTLFMSEDAEVKTFLQRCLSQSEEWIVNRKVSKLSLIIINVQSKEIMECWDFNLQYDNVDGLKIDETNQPVSKKELKKIQQEIRDVMIQISATISYLPLLDCRCSFDVMCYANNDCDVPEGWTEAQPIFIANSQNVALKQFSTGLHRMETVVNFKLLDD